MNFFRVTGIALATGVLSTAAWAQTAAEQDQQRDVNQQQRIEQGLKSGELSTKEAGSLERDEQHVDRMEANDLKNGSISPAEQARLNAAENKTSGAIYDDKHNATTGNPNSASSERMQADVQRNVNQQQRIANGMQSGALTNKEAGSLERGHAHVDRREANAAANGHVSAGEQRRIQRSENHQSNRIYNNKHNATTK
jgi:type IV secretory pathway VirB10-like protein